MWLLQGEPVPDYSTFARFRTGRTKEAVKDLFYQFVRRLEEMGETEHEEVFIDGTKIENRANRYTFVWRKTTEKYLAKVKDTVRGEFACRGISGNVTHSQFFRKSLGAAQSMSGTGHCYDNTRMESFFATLKKEKLYQLQTGKMPMVKVKSVGFRYIMTYYNRERIYTANPGGLAPAMKIYQPFRFIMARMSRQKSGENLMSRIFSNHIVTRPMSSRQNSNFPQVHDNQDPNAAFQSYTCE